MQFSRKTIYNILAPELSASEELSLLPCSRPVISVMPGGPTSDGFVLSLPASDVASSSGRQAPGPEASTSGLDGRQGPPGRIQVPLLRPAADLDVCLQQLIDLAAVVCMQHPADCDRMEIRLYLGEQVGRGGGEATEAGGPGRRGGGGVRDVGGLHSCLLKK